MSEKVVLVTGGNRGIGFAVVKKFLDEGFKVILTARNVTLGHKALNELNQHPHLYFHQLDVSQEVSVQAIKDYVQKNFGQLDVLINNAAINYDTWHHVLNADLEEVMSTINVNTLGAWRMIQAFMPLMKQKNSGKIINVSSGAGSLNSQTGQTPAYSLSKLALNGLTKQVAKSVENTEICVNTICPGWVKTDMGGENAPITPQEAAENIFWLAQNDQIRGQFVRNKEIISY